MSTTQQHLLIKDIQNNILLLKNGGGALILQVSAVNFGLLSEREQMAIIFAFAQMLNSLSFSLQIVIMSERLNIGSYLNLLSKAQKAQTNPLLSEMIIQYKQFIQSLIKENEVLDKKFYIVIPLYSLELGLSISKEHLEQKIKTVLLPRRDQVVRQLGRVGLKASEVPKEQLVELFYNLYNGEVFEEKPVMEPLDPKDLYVRLKNPETPPLANAPAAKPPVQTAPALTPDQAPPASSQASRNHPFVVEELTE